MRYVNGGLCAIMILFVIVQYNDPDFALWTVIYGIPAIWAGVAAFRAGASDCAPTHAARRKTRPMSQRKAR